MPSIHVHHLLRSQPEPARRVLTRLEVLITISVGILLGLFTRSVSAWWPFAFAAIWIAVITAAIQQTLP